MRKFAAVVAILGLLFAQLAVSAYACPMMAAAFSAGSAGLTGAGDEAATPPCHHQTSGGDQGLCQAHCQSGQQIAGEHPTGHAAADFVPSFIADVPLPQIDFPSSARATVALVHATSPPIAIRNCCFRI